MSDEEELRRVGMTQGIGEEILVDFTEEFKELGLT